MNKLIKVIFTILVLVVGSMPLARADETGGVTITALSTEVINALTNIYAGFYNQILEKYNKSVYEYDPQLPITIVNNEAQNTANTAVDEGMRELSGQLVKDSFAGIRLKTQQQLDLLKQPAEDDVIVGDKSENEKGEAGNVAFNIESLLGPKTYSDQQESNNALAFLNQLQNIAPAPKIIRLAPKFDVPIMDPNDPSRDVVTIGGEKALSSSEIKKIRDNLSGDKTYRDYKRSYRGIIAARSIYLNKLLRAYQERLPQVNGKSALQLRDDRVNSRLTEEYYTRMQKASPATISRETLFVLAEISSQLNALHEQQDLMLEMDSISGLNQLALGSKMLDMQAKDIGKKIYCMDPVHKKEKMCTTDLLETKDKGKEAAGEMDGQGHDVTKMPGI